MSIRPYNKKDAKPGEKWWMIDIGRGEARKRYTVKGTYEEAEAMHRSARGIVTGCAMAEKNETTIRIKDMVVPFLQWYRQNFSENTAHDMQFSFDLYLIPAFGMFHPTALSVEMLNTLMSNLLGKGLSHATINKHLNYFSSMIKWAVDTKKCQPLNFTIPRFPKKKTTPKESVEPLTRRQAEGMLKHVQPHYRILVLLMLDHGLRLDETLSVRVEHIDEERKVIKVIGKGNKLRRVPFMSNRFEQELETILDTRVEGPLVINPKTGKPYVTLWRELKRAARVAGVTRKINHHILRHTFATLAAESNMNPHALQKILGHSSIETTNKVYTKVGLDFVGEEANAMKKKLGR